MVLTSQSTWSRTAFSTSSSDDYEEANHRCRPIPVGTLGDRDLPAGLPGVPRVGIRCRYGREPSLTPDKMTETQKENGDR